MAILNENDGTFGAGGIVKEIESLCCGAPLIMIVNTTIGFVSARCQKCKLELGVCTKEQLLADFGIDITKMQWYPRETPKF